MKSNKGQTLIIFLIYMLVAIIVTSAAVGVLLSSSKNTDKVYQGSSAYGIAESGAETAMLKLLRDPSYTGVYTLTVGTGTATITITGGSTKIIVSKGTLGNFTRSVQVTVATSNNVLTVTSWKQI